MASIPLAFTERVRDDTSLPLPLFLRRCHFLLPLSDGLRNPPPDFVPFWTVAPVLPPSCRLDVHLHATSQYGTVSFASNLLPGRSLWPRYDAVGSNPLSLSFVRELELVVPLEHSFDSICSQGDDVLQQGLHAAITCLRSITAPSFFSCLQTLKFCRYLCIRHLVLIDIVRQQKDTLLFLLELLLELPHLLCCCGTVFL